MENFSEEVKSTNFLIIGRRTKCQDSTVKGLFGCCDYDTLNCHRASRNVLHLLQNDRSIQSSRCDDEQAITKATGAIFPCSDDSALSTNVYCFPAGWDAVHLPIVRDRN